MITCRTRRSIFLASMTTCAPLAAESPLRVTAISVWASAYCCNAETNSDSLKNPSGLPDGLIVAGAASWGCPGCMGYECAAGAEILLEIEGDSLGLSAEMTSFCASAGVSASAVFEIDRPYSMSWQGSPGWSTSFVGGAPIRLEPGVHSALFEAGYCTYWCERVGVLSFIRVYPLDIHPDGVVDAMDLAEILGHWGPCDPARTAADANLDGAVDATDLALILTGWGTDGRGG